MENRPPGPRAAEATSFAHPHARPGDTMVTLVLRPVLDGEQIAPRLPFVTEGS